MREDEIALFMHCHLCHSMKIHPDISVGISHGEEPVLVVWCNYHDELVATFELKDPPKEATCDCCKKERTQ